jgi:hypothetical protein
MQRLVGTVGWGVLVALVAMASGCSKDEAKPAPPPPPPGASAGAKPAAACAGGGGKVADTATAPFFPRTTAGYCLDPNGGDKAFGEGAPLPIDGICDVFDGECEVYKGFGVRRVVEARYVDGGGSPATVDVHLSKFATTEGAFAMFTKRTVGDGDPADEATPRPAEGGGAAALGVGNAYLWRGQYLVELTYNDESSAEAAIKAAGDKLLPPLLKEMGAKLPGEAQPLPAVAALPKESRLPMGVSFATKDALGVDGVGPGAIGYYREGDKRWRVLSIVRADAEQAKDVVATFAKITGASKEKGPALEAVRFMRKDADGVPLEWVVARAGKGVLAVGDEPRAARAGASPDERAKVWLTKDEKLERLKKATLAP